MKGEEDLQVIRHMSKLLGTKQPGPNHCPLHTYSKFQNLLRLNSTIIYTYGIMIYTISSIIFSTTIVNIQLYAPPLFQCTFP